MKLIGRLTCCKVFLWNHNIACWDNIRFKSLSLWVWIKLLYINYSHLWRFSNQNGSVKFLGRLSPVFGALEWLNLFSHSNVYTQKSLLRVWVYHHIITFLLKQKFLLIFMGRFQYYLYAMWVWLILYICAFPSTLRTLICL